VVKLGAREESQAEPRQQNPTGRKKQKRQSDSNDADNVISDWA